MSKTPIVSIITPVADRWQYIGQCIESVLSQTFSDWEQIIIDDSRTDEVSKVVSRYTDDGRIHYFRQKHLGIEGLAKTYNKALGLSRGKFIAVLEDDDFWPANKLEEQLKLFSDDKVILSWGLVKFVDTKNNIIGNYPLAWSRFPDDVLHNKPVGETLKALLFDIFMGPGVTIMFRKAALQDVGGFGQPEGAYHVDHFTYLKMALKGQFAYSREVLGYWRIHTKQVSSSLVHDSSCVAGKVFWDSLCSEERRKFGIEHLGRAVNSKFWLIRGHRAMARGDYKVGRSFLSRVVIEGCGIFRLKAALIFMGSVLAPRIVRSKLSSPLPFLLWLKKEVLHL